MLQQAEQARCRSPSATWHAQIRADLSDQPATEVGLHDLDPVLPRLPGSRIASHVWTLRQPDRDCRAQHLTGIGAHARCVPAILEDDLMVATDWPLPRDADVQLVVGRRPR